MDKKTEGYVKNSYIQGRYEINNPLFKEVIDPQSGIIYAVAYLDGFSITPIKDK